MHIRALTTLCAMLPSVKKVPQAALSVSEPNPAWFGNGPNPRNDPKWTNANWLKSRFHFSFAEYHNPKNTHFGVLRVMNDDLVQPARGFGEHPHRDMEIVTYVVHGGLTHQDSMGTKETLNRGSVQFMTAGRGIRHSEFNLDTENPLRFIQTWIVPRGRGLTPNYGSMCGDEVAELRQNQWAHLLSDNQNTDVSTPIKVAQDVNLFVTELEAGRALPLELHGNRQAYFLCMEGSVAFRPIGSDEPAAHLDQHDAAEMQNEGEETTAMEVIAGDEGAHVLYYEMAFSRSGGRGDL